jgi:arylsulfatase A-like enzyme
VKSVHRTIENHKKNNKDMKVGKNIGKEFFICCMVLLNVISTPKNATSQTADSIHSHPNILFLLADDWGWPSANLYGDSVIKLPTFDWIAAQGMLFNNAFCAAPSCSPSRASILTGEYPHQLEQGSQLWGTLLPKFPNYTVLLENAGYLVGLTGKGYGPSGNERSAGYVHNPAGKHYKNFSDFLDAVKKGQPFCFWFGSHKPHRPYPRGIGRNLDTPPAGVQVPAYLPDVREIQEDFLDYYFEVQQFDSACRRIVLLLKEKDLLKNTLIVMSGDNGFPFPRAKANLYDGGTHIPLAVMWKGVVTPKTVSNAFVSLADLAPTFLEAAGLPIPRQMTARSMLSILKGRKKDHPWDRVYLEMERHAYARKGNVGYPMRAIRTEKYLYIRNFEPERWPAGDPVSLSRLGAFADCDASPSKEFVITHDRLRIKKSNETYFQAAFGKRPAEQLYVLKSDPYEMNDVAGNKRYRAILIRFRKELEKWMEKTNDPRANDPHTDVFNTYPYYGQELEDTILSKFQGSQ